MPNIQDKDFYSFCSPLPSEMQDISAEDEDSHAVFVKSINACSVRSMPSKWSVSAGREHG
ncbi:Hypothetical protein FKW44_004221 [Caligus rogercresseyi]|uniref:Uncharacterized protein n=1 Tax=Caligus rogercresseyi TaxID=217165 RepID=A0A7T8HLB8_CALRO|nr:Hypothetical protein FKW44_004221 [Caligus rogercresseyi]